MHRRATIAVLALLAATHATLPPARADADETRLAVRGGASYASFEAFETSDGALLGGGGAVLSFGLSNTLDVGVELAYLGRPNVQLGDARLDDIGGDGFTLYANAHVIDVGGAAALRPAWFGVRLRPVVSLRVGLNTTLFTSPELFAPAGTLAVAGDTERAFRPYVGVSTGVSYRLSDALAVDVLLDATASAAHTLVGVRVELAWLTYGLL